MIGDMEARCGLYSPYYFRYMTKSRNIIPPWSHSYKILADITKTTGNANIKQREDGEKTTIGTWIAEQRICYKDGTIYPERIELLERLSGWVWDSRDATYWYKLTLLANHCEETKTSRVPKKCYAPDGTDLHQFIHLLRRAYRKQSKFLTADIISFCESLPEWSWSPYKTRAADAWAWAYQDLMNYRDEYGDIKVLPRYITSDGFGLGGWIRSQRRREVLGTILKTEYNKLNKLTGWRWSAVTKEKPYGSM